MRKKSTQRNYIHVLPTIIKISDNHSTKVAVLLLFSFSTSQLTCSWSTAFNRITHQLIFFYLFFNINNKVNRFRFVSSFFIIHTWWRCMELHVLYVSIWTLNIDTYEQTSWWIACSKCCVLTMARILPAELDAQYGVTISTFDSHASTLKIKIYKEIWFYLFLNF